MLLRQSERVEEEDIVDRSLGGRYGKVQILDPIGTRIPTHRPPSTYPVAIPTVGGSRFLVRL
jgi:hypothetical protein